MCHRVLQWLHGFVPFAKFPDFIETGGAAANMSKGERELRTGTAFRQADKGIASRATSTLRIREVPMHDRLECIDQFCFPVHSA